MTFKAYRRIVPLILLLLHLVLLFQVQQQKLQELSAGTPHAPLTIVQLLDISVNFPAFFVAMHAATISNHASRLFAFCFATPFIPILWYGIFVGIDHRAQLMKALSSPSLVWRIFRRLVGIISALIFVLLLAYGTSKGPRDNRWLTASATLWFALLVVACFWPRARKLKSLEESEGLPLEHSPAFPSAESRPESVQRIARLGDRIIAAVLDGVLILPLFAITIGFTARYYHVRAGEDGTVTLNGGPALFVMFVSTVLWCGYYFLAEWLSGRTLGKEIMGIQVLALTGEKCGLRRAFLRNVLRPVDGFAFYFVGFVAALLSPINQSIGDRTAGTIARENPLARRKSTFLAWLIIFVGFSAGSFALLRLLQR